MTTVHVNSTEQISIEGDRPVLVIGQGLFGGDIVIEFGNATALMHFFECTAALVENEARKLMLGNLSLRNLIDGVTA